MSTDPAGRRSTDGFRLVPQYDAVGTPTVPAWVDELVRDDF